MERLDKAALNALQPPDFSSGITVYLRRAQVTQHFHTSTLPLTLILNDSLLQVNLQLGPMALPILSPRLCSAAASKAGAGFPAPSLGIYGIYECKDGWKWLCRF
nr:PREDICTED: vacuolar ATPase assembly integral membrane protein VMA21 isoform X1 [Equus przewalskii]